MAQTPAVRVATGDYINYTPGSAVTAGDVIEVGSIPLVATSDIAASELGALATEGVFDVPKTSDAFTAGDAVYWNSSGNPVTGTAGTGAADSATGNLMGYAIADAASGDSYVRTHLTAAKRTTTIGGSVTADDITGSDSSMAVSGKAGAGGGAGGAIPIVGGAGHTNGAGGAVSVTGGASAGSGTGGAASLVGGAGGATGTGGAASVTGGAGGSSSGTGGAVAIAAGAGTAGNANGGAVTILAGNAHGSGTDGTIGIGTSNTSAITIGAASIATALAGPVTLSIGDSTAAAGSTNADAQGLPAGTASVYPTTAADDTKGVIIDVADKVTGRTLFIGNGVANKILKVYPPSGGTINGAAANAAFSSVSGKGVIITCLSSGSNTWLAW